MVLADTYIDRRHRRALSLWHFRRSTDQVECRRSILRLPVPTIMAFALALQGTGTETNRSARSTRQPRGR